MLNFLSNNRNQKLISAIRDGDLDKLAPLLKKYDAAALDGPLADEQSAAQLAILAQQAGALELILNAGCNANARSSASEALLVLALKQEKESLALMTQLLRAGGDPNTEGLALGCFDHCEDNTLMVHLSRLLEQGADLFSDHRVILRALDTERLDLIHYLINAGAGLPDECTGADCSDETWSYARRCLDDRKVREMMQGF